MGKTYKDRPERKKARKDRAEWAWELNNALAKARARKQKREAERIAWAEVLG